MQRLFRIYKLINFCVLLRDSKSFKRLYLEILVLLYKKLYLCVMLKKEKPIFMKSLFWDVEFEKIDYEKRASCGDIDDIRNCRRYYGDEKIREVLLNSKGLSMNRIYLFAGILDEKITNFKCYILQQSNQLLTPY